MSAATSPQERSAPGGLEDLILGTGRTELSPVLSNRDPSCLQLCYGRALALQIDGGGWGWSRRTNYENRNSEEFQRW